MEILKREVWIEKIIPAFIFFALWIDGWLLPLILVPIFYVLMIEKKNLGWLGFSKHELGYSLFLSLIITGCLIAIYYPIFFHYLPYTLGKEDIDIYTVFSDVFHYPVYEEIAYRSFVLIHFAKLDSSPLSNRNLILNLTQSLLFVSIHKHHFSQPLILIPVFLLGLLNGLLFLKTKNIYGCIFSHSILNGFALLLLNAVTARW